MTRRLPPALLAAGVASVAAVMALLPPLWAARDLAGGLGLPLDDAWIHLRFADNLAAGGGFAFNPGEPYAGSTSPLWVLLLTVQRLLAVAPVTQAIMLSAGMFVATAALAAALACRLQGAVQLDDRSLTRRPALVGVAAGVLAALAGRMVWAAFSGMEVGLFAALTLAACGLFVADRGWRLDAAAGILVGLAILARPEGWLFAVVAAILALADGRGRDWRRRAMAALAVSGSALGVSSAWVLFCLRTTGSPVAGTFRPNGGGWRWPDLSFLRQTAAQLWADSPPVVILAAAGATALLIQALRQRRPRLLLAPAWVLALPLVAAVVAPNLRHHGRYNMPLLPFLAVLAALGAAAVIQILARDKRARRRAPVMLALLLSSMIVVSAVRVPAWARTYGRNVESIRAQHERAASWLSLNAGPGCRLATHDIGAMGMISGCHITDLIGLVTPEIAALYQEHPEPRRRDPLIRQLLVERRITHLALYPGWFPALARDAALTPLFTAEIKEPTVAGAPRLVIYRAAW